MINITNYLIRSAGYAANACPPEDVVFDGVISRFEPSLLAPQRLLKMFAVETMAYPDPIGVHQPWSAHPKGRGPYDDMMHKYPFLAQLKALNAEWRYETGQKSRALPKAASAPKK